VKCKGCKEFEKISKDEDNNSIGRCEKKNVWVAGYFSCKNVYSKDREMGDEK